MQSAYPDTCYIASFDAKHSLKAAGLNHISNLLNHYWCSRRHLRCLNWSTAKRPAICIKSRQCPPSPTKKSDNAARWHLAIGTAKVGTQTEKPIIWSVLLILQIHSRFRRCGVHKLSSRFENHLKSVFLLITCNFILVVGIFKTSNLERWDEKTVHDDGPGQSPPCRSSKPSMHDL